MLTMNQTPLSDNKSIMVIKVDLESDGVLYFSDTKDKITLSSVDFDGKVIFKNSLSDLTEYIDLSDGGGLGTVGHFSFSIARYNNYTGASDFFNSFYPATGMPLLTSKVVDVGIVWEGATALTDITWLKRYLVEDYSWDDMQLNLACVEYDEFSATDLPYYRVQDEIPNDISFAEDLDEESRGKVVPIIYGDFSTLNLAYSSANLSPAIRSGKGFSFLVASHLCNEITAVNRLYQYLDGPKAYLSIYGNDVSTVNKWSLHKVDLDINRNNSLYAELIMQPNFATSEYGFNTPAGVENCMDNSDASSVTLNAGQKIGLVLPANIPSNLFGNTDGSLASCSFNVLWDSGNGATQSIKLEFYHVEKERFSGPDALQTDSTINSKTTTFQFGDGTQVGAKRDTNVADWSIDELQKLYYSITNTGSGPIRIYNAYVKFNQLKFYEVVNIPKGQGLLIQRGGKRLMYGEGKYIFGNSLKDTKDLFATVKGYEFDGWID